MSAVGGKADIAECLRFYCALPDVAQHKNQQYDYRCT